MKQSYAVIIIPGLGDDTRILSWITRNWRRKLNITPIVYSMNWKKNESFQQNLTKLLILIDKTHKQFDYLSLIGTSAGGSAVINAFCQRKDKIHKVINVCGRLRKGENIFPSLDSAAKNSPSFKESVLLCEKNLEKLTPQDKTKILTIRPLIDEVVPTSCVPIPGAINKTIFSVEHGLSIALCFTVYSNRITYFLTIE